MTGRVTTHGGGAWLLRCGLIALLFAAWFLCAAGTVRADPTDSILTYGCDPPLPRTSANCAIWHTSPVNLRWTLVDPNFTPVSGSSCDTTSITQDTSGTDVTCAVQDASLTQVQKTVRLRVDQTSPTVSGAAPARGADNSGWWNHAVDWLFAGTDATSGIAGCDTVTYSGPDSASGDVAGACRDNAGNSKTGHVAIKYDATAPSVTGATPARQADQAGWWNHAVKWTFTGSDAMSGVASCDAPTYSGPDSATGDVSGACRDNAGNTVTGHAAIKYDATAPAITSITPARAADQGGWWNHAVKVTFAGSDATSGVASCDAPTYSAPDSATGDVSGACRDNAGNTVTGHLAIKYDATNPAIPSATISRPPDQNGWWNHPVDVVFASTDVTSGIAACDTVTYSGPDDAARTVGGSCTDAAGNSSSSSKTIKYDHSPPTITSVTPDRPPDHDGWWNHPVTIAFAGTDALSGLAYCDTIVYAGSETPSTDVTGNCADAAGNVATGSLPVNYDDQPPGLSALPAEVGSNQAVIHWNSSQDTVLTEVTRSPGIGNAAASTVYSGTGESFADSGVQNGQAYTYSIRAQDAAANIASVSLTVTPEAPAPDPVPLASAAPPSVTGGTPGPLQPPRLDWRRVKGATYYNFQLFRGSRKILSMWPRLSELQLRLRWTFRGREIRLTPGSYHWYVWPGFGKRSQRRYGRLLADRRFTVD